MGGRSGKVRLTAEQKLIELLQSIIDECLKLQREILIRGITK